MITWTCSLIALLVTTGQEVAKPTQTSSTAVDDNTRALRAMERAAKAAEEAAQAASKAASAAAKVAGIEAAEPGKPGTTPAAAGWAGTFGAGLIWIAGNAEQLTFSASLNLEKKTEDWIYAAKANAIYGQATVRPSAADAAMGVQPMNQVVALAGGVLLRADRRFTKQITGYLAVGSDADHVKSVEYRVTGEGGSGITWLEEKEGDLTKVLLRSDLGIRYARESRFQYYPTQKKVGDVDLAAPRLGIVFRYALSKDVQFSEEAEILPNIIGDFRYLLNSTSKISAHLTEIFSFATSLQVNHDSAPAPGKKDTDSIMTVGVELAL